ncbi:MAG: hypothetical protein HUU15_08605 [Candidatus Brocadiae bacterium]|nr:hypothetical protein [Candidatus Brocadiia bacterium]
MSGPHVPPGYRTQSDDTSIAAEQLQIAAWRRLTPTERVGKMWELSAWVRGIAEAEVRRRHPDAPEREVQLRVASRRFGRDLMVRAFGWDPDVHGY